MTRDQLIETMARASVASRNLPEGCDINWDAFRRDATAALTAIEAAGMRVVPVEPSEKMRVAALNVGLPNYDDAPLYAMVWRAMVLAAQEDSTSE